MNAHAKGFVAGLEKCFNEPRDPRARGRCDPLLIDILAIALLAVLSSAEDWPDIELFAQRRRKWLPGFLRIPSHDTFRRVLGRLDRQ